jgi:hypothetical protein
MNSFHGAKPGYLPSCLANIGDNSYDFIAGPELVVSFYCILPNS